MSKIKLAIVDDHKMFLQSTVKLIETEKDMEVILEAENGIQLLELLKSITPDIILMDIRMPKMNGFEASYRVRELYPEIKIIAFSQYDYEDNIIKMNIRGVKSFIGKNDHPSELFKAIRTVYGSGAYMTNLSLEIIQNYIAKVSKYLKDLPDSINEQEKILIKMIVAGLTSKEIGIKIEKSHRTVEDMRDKLYEKFNVTCKEQLIALASKWDLI